MLRKQFKIALIISFILLNSGCARLDLSWFLQSYDDIQTTKIDRIESEADALLASGKAIETLQLLYESNIPIVKFKRHGTMAMNLLLKQAGDKYVAGDLVAAGALYRNAFNLYPGNKLMHATITASKEQVATFIDHCADQLLETGLLAYREGQLQKAISVWSQIRQFHPDYKASKQAIQTTRKQLKNLEQFKNPS